MLLNKRFKISILLLIIGTTISSCEKGDDFCQPPQEVNGFLNIKPSYLIQDSIKVELNYIFNYGQEIHETTTLFSFSIPDIFINPKGDERPVDVVEDPVYYYKFKDTTNLPDAVTIEAFAFNDCGESETATAVLHFE